MPTWLLIVIISAGEFLIFLAILGAIVFKCSSAMLKAKRREELANERAERLQSIINAYGMREMRIGRDK